MDLHGDSDVFGPLIFCVLLGMILFLVYLSRHNSVGRKTPFREHIRCCADRMFVYSLHNQCDEQDWDFNDESMECSGIFFNSNGFAGVCQLIFQNDVHFLVLKFRGVIAAAVSFLSIFWAAFTASRFLSCSSESKGQLFLIAYPVLLFYSCFALFIIY